MGEIQIPAKTRIRAVARLELEPRDFDETAKFYRRLGFQVTIRGDAGKRSADLKAGDVRVRFTEARDSAQDRRRSPFTRLRLCFRVVELEALALDLRSRGLEVPDVGTMVPRRVELIDPNGVRLLLEEEAG